MIKFNPIGHQKIIKQPKGLLPVDFNTQLNQLVNNIKKRAEFEISDKNPYLAINEYFKNTDKKYNCRAIAMTISQDQPNKSKHLLEVSMLHPTMTIENKRPLAYGDKKTILNYLDKLNVKELIKTDIIPMSEKLKNI